MDRARRARELSVVAAALIAACGSRAPHAAEVAAAPPLAVPSEIGRGRVIAALAADGGALWWADLDGVYVRAPGAEARLVAGVAASSIAVKGGVVWTGGADGVARVATDGAVTRIAGIAGDARVAAGGAGVFAAAGGTFYAIAGDGATARATAAGAITAIAVGDLAVAWAEWDDAGGRGVVRRIEPGGAPQVIARLAAPARAIAMRGDQVVWSGDASAIAQWDGRGARVRIAGRGIAIAADHDGVVVHTDAGLIIEHVDHPDGGEAAYVVDQARAGHDLSPAAIAIDERAAYVVEVRPDGGEAIVAVPRPGNGPRVLALVPEPARRLVGENGGALIALSGTKGLERATLGTIEPLVADIGGELESVDAVAVHGGEIWIADGPRLIARAPAGAWRGVSEVAAAPAALAITDDSVYWIDGAALWRMPNGNTPTVVWHADPSGPVQQANAAFAVLADGTVVTTGAGFTVGDLIAIGNDGATHVLAPMRDAAFGAKVVADGKRVYYVVGATEVWGVDVGGSGAASVPVRIVGPGNEVVDLAAGGGWLYAAVMVDGVAHIVRSAGQDQKRTIDLGATPGLVPGTMIARADGVVWATEDTRAILMFPAPAP